MTKAPLYTRGNQLQRSAMDETKWCIFNNEYYRINTEIDRRKKYKDNYTPQRILDMRQRDGWRPAVWEVISPSFWTSDYATSRTHNFFKSHAEAIKYVSDMVKEIKKAREIDAKFYEGKRDTPS
jgi:hypothetical protein